MVGENIKILMPEPYHFDYGDYLKAYKNREADKSIGSGREISSKRKDGTVFPASLAVGKVIINGNIFLQKLSEI